MDRGILATLSTDDIEWWDRSEFWSNYRPKKLGRKKKYTFREPLILVGHGARVCVDHNTLLVRNGFTHYPQKPEEMRFFPGDPNLPDRIIILDASGGISFDAFNWLSDQKISLVQLNWKGRVSFSGNSGFAANPKLVQWQSEIRDTPKALELNRQIICSKLDASAETIKSLFGASEVAKIAIAKVRSLKSNVLELPVRNYYSKVLGYEGAAAAIYYRLWHDLPLKWTKLAKRPIPPDWHKVGSRSMAWRREGNHARHPVNAMLNYGYGMVIGQLHSEIVAAGFDPSIGFAHSRDKNRIPFVYDLVEPLRPVVDRTILSFVLSNTFEPGDFTITRLGGCRLNPKLAKAVAGQVTALEAGPMIKRLLGRI